MRIYRFNKYFSEDFSLLRIVKETDFTDEEFDRLANLNVGESLPLDPGGVGYYQNPFTITRIK